MGIWDRIEDWAKGGAGRAVNIVEGPVDAINEVAEVFVDLAKAPVSDDEYEGILGTFSGVILDRGAKMMNDLFGPNEGFGAAIGALPEGVRGPGRSVLNPIFEGLEYSGREWIREPAATALIAASLADTGDGNFLERNINSITGLFDPKVWQKGHEMAQTTSVGQAFALAIGTRDITDDSEVNDFMGTALFTTVSGTTDALFRIFLEPDAFLAKGALAARASRRTGNISFMDAYNSRYRNLSTMTRDGGGMGAILDEVVPQLGKLDLETKQRIGRFSRLGNLHMGSTRTVNEVIRDSYRSLPDPLKNIFISEQAYTGRSAAKLLDNEIGNLLSDARKAEKAGDAFRADRLRRQVARIEAGDLQSLTATRLQEARAADWARYLDTPAQARSLRDWIKGSPSVERFYGRVIDLAEEAGGDLNLHTGLIHDRYFPNHAQGDLISSYLARAVAHDAGGLGEFKATLGYFTGDLTQLDVIAKSNGALAADLTDLAEEMGTIKAPAMWGIPAELPDGQLTLASTSPNELDLRNHEGRIEAMQQRAKEIDETFAANERLESTWASIQAPPDPSLGQRTRAAIKSSTTYQTSPFVRPLRTFVEKIPHHMNSLADSNASAQFARFLRSSGYDDIEITRLRGEMDNTPIHLRAELFEREHQRAVRKLAGEHGLTAREVEEITAHADRGWKAARKVIAGSTYDGAGRAKLYFEDVDGTIEYPFFTSQIQTVVPVPDMKKVRRELERVRVQKYGDDWEAGIKKFGGKGRDLTGQALGDLMSVWKTTVLLRPGWTIRVVILDEQFRQMAKFGALTTLLDQRDRINNYAARLASDEGLGKLMPKAGKNARISGGAAGFVAGTALAGPIGGVIGAGVGGRLLNKMANIEYAGPRNVTMSPHKFDGAFGAAPGSSGEIYRGLNSAGGSLSEFVDAPESVILQTLRRDPNGYRVVSYTPTPETGSLRVADAQQNAAYRNEWVRLARQHFRQNPLARQLLENDLNRNLTVNWLRETLEGRNYASKLPGRWDIEAWVEGVAEQLDSYTFYDPKIRGDILRLPEHADDAAYLKILDEIDDETRALNPIHGAVFEQTLGDHTIIDSVNNFVEHSFAMLGTMATDELSRNPTFTRFYEAEMQRLGALTPGNITVGQVAALEDQARRYALRNTRELLYDLAERSEFAQLTRFIMPFFPAFEEVLTRWAGLVVENPRSLTFGRQIWESPSRTPDSWGLTYTDEEGNDFIQVRIPEFARGILGKGIFSKALASQETVRFDKGGFNLVAQGTPGFGPFAVVGVSEVVKRKPELADSVKFILPFGPQSGIEAFLPPTVKRAISANEQEDDRAFAYAANRIALTRIVKMQNGEIPKIDFTDPEATAAFHADVFKEAQDFFHLRMMASFVAPVAPIFDSPYKPYIDVYRSLRAGNLELAAEGIESITGLSPTEVQTFLDGFDGDADGLFLDVFGDEYFALTQSFTRSNNGVPPTLYGIEQQEVFGELIRAYPEWGATIIGDAEGSGTSAEFSRAAYDRQLTSDTFTGSGTRQREQLSLGEVTTDPNRRLGWIKYIKLMDMIDYLRVSRGLPNLQVAGAESLRDLRNLAINGDPSTGLGGLKDQYPTWWQDFQTRDEGAFTRKLKGAYAIVEEERLLGRADITGLKDYLALRDGFIQILAARAAQGGAKSLNASSNQDLLLTWETLVADLVERNVAFAPLYHRHLEQDMLDLSTTREEVTR